MATVKATAKTGGHWTPPWVAACGALAAVAAALAMRNHALPVYWWLPAVLALPAGFVVTVATAMADTPTRSAVHRVGAVVVAFGWVSWVAAAGWSQVTVLVLIVGALLLVGLEIWLAATPEPDPAAPDMPAGDRRPTPVKEWEGLLRRITRQPVTVRTIEPWPNPHDGQRVHVDLPEGMTVTDLAGFADRVSAAPRLRLPQGCQVAVLDGPHQCEAVIDVMLRDCLADGTVVHEDTDPASIYDEFPVLSGPRGETMSICLRSQSAVIGGAPDSGKTTLLRRIIMFLARCTDALIWVVDLNGGGLAEPLVSPWARGEASAPVVDWVADNPEEGAVLIATATAIIKDRKSSGEAIRRKRAHNTNLLPVDETLPAIIVLTDEGGEVRQAAGLLGRLVCEGISRFAQIGRAEGGRAIMSVLRGTADLLDKGLRVVASIRICLRMLEHDEYGHVLGTNPGRAKLIHRGSAYIKRDTDLRPLIARSSDVPPDVLERHAIATAHLRPKLDDRGRRVAAKVTVKDVLDGREPGDHPEIARTSVMRDVAAGRAYEGRWDRFAPKLAEMRGEDPPDVDGEDVAAPVGEPGTPTVARPGSAMEALLLGTGVTRAEPGEPATAHTTVAPAPPAASVDVTNEAEVDAEARRLLDEWMHGPAATERQGPRQPAAAGDSAPMTTRERILAMLTEMYPDQLLAAEIGRRLDAAGAGVSKQRVGELLGALLKSGDVVKGDDGRFGVARRG